MRSAIHVISPLGILSLSLIILTGCGEKRIHVSTASGTPGQETGASISDADTTGLTGTSIDESSLTGQASSTDEGQGNVDQPVATSDFAYDPNHMDESFKQNLQAGIPSDQDADSDTINSDLVAPLNGGNDFSTQGNDISTQSSSPSMDGLPQDQTGTFPFTSQTDFQNALSNLPEDVEPIPENIQVAKAELPDILRDQLDKIQEEELATVFAGLEDVFFQFDSWSLTAEAKESLERDRTWLTNDPSSQLIIEGHADQRGTQAYNMVLGKRRAMAIRDFLSQLGVEPSRLTVISYGKDKPFCQDISEVCHQLNRRGHLLVQN